MQVEPAHISQIRLGEDGRVYELSADACSVAADLQAIDSGLKVRFMERGKCWVIYHEAHPNCPHNAGPEGHSYLVKSIQAHQGRTGVWLGLDQSVVDRFREIDPEGRGHYDYAQALEDAAKARERRLKKEREEMFAELAEFGAHAIRKDLGLGPYKGRVFKPRDLEAA